MPNTPFVRRAPFALALFFALAAFVSAAAPARAQQRTGSPNLVVSQIYTRGGEAGAAHPNDFIELFNRGNTTVDLTQYSVQITTVNGNTTTTFAIGIVSSRSFPMQPGQYHTFTFPGGQPQPPPAPQSLGTSGRIAVVRGREPIAPVLGCQVLQDPDIEDFVGYGAVTCFEGTGPAPAPTLAQATYRAGDGCTDTDDNGADFALSAAPAPRNGVLSGPCVHPPGTTTFRFGIDGLNASENVASVQVTVVRTGDLSQPATVDYATADALSDSPIASERKDYTTAAGTLRFAAGETSKSFPILINDDALAEGGAEFFRVVLSNPSANAELGDPFDIVVSINDNDATNGATNPIDDPTFFVRAHYADFLGREPDQAGLDFWVSNFTQCNGDAECLRVRRVNVSAAFFLSIEFQETGYYAYRLYKAAYPNSADTAARPRGFPTYREFIRDSTEAGRDVIVGQGNWQQQLEQNKQQLAIEFVQRAEFVARYPTTMTPVQFVDALYANAGVTPSDQERAEAIAQFRGAAQTTDISDRANVLRRVADDEDFRRAELNRAFVLMQYFGYLRRSPNAAPDTNFDGYDFWLSKLNQFNGNYVDAEMVRAFIESIEYRQRFGQ